MTPIPVSVRQRILQLYERGKSTREIAQFCGFCVAAVPSSDDPGLGYVVFGRGGVGTTGPLMAQPFDVRKLDLVGEPVPIADQVSPRDFSASRTGTLTYRSGGALLRSDQVTLFDRQGKVLGTAGELGYYRYLAFSPDGKRVLASRYDQQSPTSENLWMTDLARGISTRFTFDSHHDFLPVWSPDGDRIAFASDRDGAYRVFQKLSNGGGDDELLLKLDQGDVPLSWSGDGRFLLVGQEPGDSGITWVLPVHKNAHPTGKPFLFAGEGIGIDLKFSPGPQGHPLWVAYSSKESGRWEIYVRPFDPNSPTGTPPAGGKWQVSTDGGSSPRWNGNGKELFYVAPDGTVMSVEVNGRSTAFQSGIPKPLFKPKGLAPQSADYFYWDVSSDGQKFIFAVAPSATAVAPPARFTVVLNWPSLLKQ